MAKVCGVSTSNIPPWTPPEPETVASYKAVFESFINALVAKGIDVGVAWLPEDAALVTSTPCVDGDPRDFETVMADEINARMWWSQPGLVPLYSGTECGEGCQWYGGVCPASCSILTLVATLNAKL